MPRIIDIAQTTFPIDGFGFIVRCPRGNKIERGLGYEESLILRHPATHQTHKPDA